jgi:hypothetical protein
MEVESFISQNKCSYTQLCCICGDNARGVNFAVVSCMSCKMFFRRHAQSQAVGHFWANQMYIFQKPLFHIGETKMSL